MIKPAGTDITHLFDRAPLPGHEAQFKAGRVLLGAASDVTRVGDRIEFQAVESTASSGRALLVVLDAAHVQLTARAPLAFFDYEGQTAIKLEGPPMNDQKLKRDGVLGWIGAVVIGGLVWALFAGGPSDREQAARLAVADTVEQIEIRAANERLYERGQ